MKLLKIRRDNSTAVLRTRPHWGARDSQVEHISKKAHIMITGAHHSGKSKMVHKLFDDAETLWYHQVKPYHPTSTPNQDKPKLKEGDAWEFPMPVLLNGTTSLAMWTDHEGIAKWWEANNETPYKKLTAGKRVELIADYLRATRAILFVDDAHKLTGRKAVIVKQCIEAAFRFVIACNSENRLQPSIRRLVLEKKPQHLMLNSPVAYDATHILVWSLVFVCFMLGLTEIAAVIGLFETLKGGRNASRQD